MGIKAAEVKKIPDVCVVAVAVVVLVRKARVGLHVGERANRYAGEEGGFELGDKGRRAIK